MTAGRPKGTKNGLEATKPGPKPLSRQPRRKDQTILTFSRSPIAVDMTGHVEKRPRTASPESQQIRLPIQLQAIAQETSEVMAVPNSAQLENAALKPAAIQTNNATSEVMALAVPDSTRLENAAKIAVTLIAFQTNKASGSATLPSLNIDHSDATNVSEVENTDAGQPSSTPISTSWIS